MSYSMSLDEYDIKVVDTHDNIDEDEYDDEND